MFLSALSGVSLFAALGFLLYGGRLFLMLQRFPVESKGRRKKLQEVFSTCGFKHFRKREGFIHFRLLL